HEQALPAARADVCAAKQGKGEALAERLMQLEELTPQSIRRAAIGVGVNADDFDRCLSSKEPDAQVAADSALLEEAGMVGLPTTSVGAKRLLGAVSEAALRDAFDHAAKGEGDMGIPGVVFAPLALFLLGGIAWLGRSRRVKLPDGPSR